MATLLPAIPHSPFGRSLNGNLYPYSASPSPPSLTRKGSSNSHGTIHHVKQHSGSSSNSYISGFSTLGASLRVRNENRPPLRSVSFPTLGGTDGPNNVSRLRNPSLPTRVDSPFEDIDLNDDCGSNRWDGIPDISKDLGIEAKVRLSFDLTPEHGLPRSDARAQETLLPQEPQPSAVVKDPATNPFRKWMSSLRRKNTGRRRSLTPRTERWSLDDNDERHPNNAPQKQDQRHSRHQKTSSQSSSGFITAVKSASISLASFNVAPRSRHAARSGRFKSEHRSSGLSQNDCRPSTENGRKTSGTFMDEAAWDRALKRRKILEELVSSEESYVADLKVLTNVCSLDSYP